MTTLSILFLGLVLGMRHATDADHVAAVATLAARQSTLAGTVRQGVAWGIGHTLMLMLFGGAILAHGGTIADPLVRVLEAGVAVMLVALGFDMLWRRRAPHAVDCARLGPERQRRDSRVAPRNDEPTKSRIERSVAIRWPVRATAVGMMHGMAGSAALVLLSLDAVASPAIGVMYIAVFGVGSIAGMALLSAAMALPLSFGGTASARLRDVASVAVSLFTMGLGCTMLWRLASGAAL